MGGHTSFFMYVPQFPLIGRLTGRIHKKQCMRHPSTQKKVTDSERGGAHTSRQKTPGRMRHPRSKTNRSLYNLRCPVHHRAMDKLELDKALTRLGQLLRERRVAGEIAVFGGAAIVLGFDFRSATQDVDAMITEGHGEVVKAQQEVGKELGLPPNWLKEQGTSYLSKHSDLKNFQDLPLRRPVRTSCADGSAAIPAGDEASLPPTVRA